MTFIWGLNFVVVKTTFLEISPLAFMALRFLTASILFLVVVRISQQGFHIPRAAWGRVALLGILGTTIYQPLFLVGLSLSQASNSALILATTPAFVVLLNRFLYNERFAMRGWIGLALSFSGLALIIFSGGGVALGGSALLGNAMILGATICWSLFSVLSAPLLKRYSSLSVAALSTIMGTVPLLFISAPAVASQNWSQVTLSGWLGLIYSAGLAIVVAYILWNTGVKRIGSARTAIYNNLTPVIATFGAAVFLGEPLTIFKIVGAAIIFIGLYLSRTANLIIEPEG
jgi:drug/metabolite transporter (DMT)-like permease